MQFSIIPRLQIVVEIQVAILSVIQLWDSEYKQYILSVKRLQYVLIVGHNLPLLIYALVISD